MGSEDEPLTGFHWRGGSDRDTTGILMWSEPFILKRNDNKEEIAILLMDTQGAFDSQSTVKDCATVFALSLMISSIHVYNIMQNLQEDDLQHLHLFTEYGKIALEDSNEIPFQKLTFLIRDWNFPYEHKYGYEGGKDLLDKRFELKEKQHNELKELRINLKRCFDTLNCYLMPHPGLKVCTSPEFNGQLKDIEKEFKEYVKKFVEGTFDKLSVKQINGREITTLELFEYFKAYCRVFEADELPEPKSMLMATSEANNLAAKAIAKEFYINAMEQHCGGDRPYCHPHHLVIANTQIKESALSKFHSVPKMGGESLSVKYLAELNKEMDELFENYVRHNDSKNIFAFSRTATSLLAIMVFSYLLSGLLEFFWLGSFSFILNFLFWSCFFLLCAWIYVKYSGEYKEIGEYIDGLADILWRRVYQPVYERFIQHAIRAMLSYAPIQEGPQWSGGKGDSGPPTSVTKKNK
jgi:atlastin